MTEEVVKLSKVMIKLPCNHYVPFGERAEKCKICLGQDCTFPQVNGFSDTTFEDEDDKLRIQIHLLGEKLQLFQSELQISNDGKLKIRVVDAKKGIDTILPPVDIHKIHTQLSMKKSQYEMIAKAGKSVLKCLMDDDYRKKYMNNLGQVKKLALKFGKGFILKLIGILGGSAVATAVGGLIISAIAL